VVFAREFAGKPGNFLSVSETEIDTPGTRQALLHQTACAVRCAEGGFQAEAFFVASLKTSLVWDSSSLLAGISRMNVS
jgi:hypothetical protein